MSEQGDRSVFERPLEALVYAPLGFALEARQIYPRMVDRGRNQILLARLIGRYATRQAVSAAEGAVERGTGQAVGALRLLGVVPEPAPGGPPPATASGDEGPTVERAPGSGGAAGEGGGPSGQDAEARVPPAPASDAVDVAAPPAPEAPVPAVDSLAIPDYDSLAASQVVPRLEALTADELEAVRCYEAGVRGRKTILAKIAQLQAV